MLTNVQLITLRAAAIAAILSEGRTCIVSREVGDGAVAIALGIPGGPVFLYQLELAAYTSPGASATDSPVSAIFCLNFPRRFPQTAHERISHPATFST